MKNYIEAMTIFACKAAGWRVEKAEGTEHFYVHINDDVWLMDFAIDDGDSRMLQVACKITLTFEVIGGEWCAEAYSQDDADGDAHCAYEPLKDDAKKAACMAVLRCAAMIGEAME